MCGIVGYIGTKSAQEVLLSGLRRLEYRGYDSAGIVTLGSGKVNLVREKGKVEGLARLAADAHDTATIGIGHTRWATHGEPSVKNAHPHQAGKVYLVHNGIIENYRDIKQTLSDKGIEFVSDTDTEVLAKLIEYELSKRDDNDLLESVRESLKIVVGAYGIAVVHADNDQEIVVARKGSPLIIGLNKDETFIASDASALIGFTDQVLYLNDGEMALCKKGDVSLYDINAAKIDAVTEKLEMDIEAVQKRGYDHFLLKEIMEQPDTLAATLRGRLIKDVPGVRLGGLNMTDDELRAFKNIVVVGCGTAYYAGLMASYFIEQLLDDVTVQVEVASELRYRSFNVADSSVALIVSQSGETADTLACLEELKKRGIKTLGFINAVGSTIARTVDGGVYLHVGPEISVASTKAFTSQVVAMVMFGVRLAEVRGVNTTVIQELIAELDKLPGEIKRTLSDKRDEVKNVASLFSDQDHALYLGRDNLYPIAMEGSLKLKEVSYVHAEGYAAGELKHGPIALIDNRFFEVFLVVDNWLFDKSMSNLSEIRARGGNVLVVTDSDRMIDAEKVIAIKSDLKIFKPLLINVVLQLLAYYIAVDRGTDVDQPRNLAKSVTVE